MVTREVEVVSSEAAEVLLNAGIEGYGGRDDGAEYERDHPEDGWYTLLELDGTAGACVLVGTPLFQPDDAE